MAKRPPKGLSIEDAFRRYADLALLARLDELEPHANGFTAGVTEHLHNEYQGLHDAIAQSLSRRLQRGELIARGLVRGAPVAQGKVDVDPDWWAELEICFELDEICGPKHFVMTAVEIREAEPDDAEGQASPNSGQPTLAHSGDQVRADRGVLHLSENGEVLTVGTTRMVFRGSVHKAIVRQLVQAHAKNEWVRTADLLQQARSRSDTLAKAFSGAATGRPSRRSCATATATRGWRSKPNPPRFLLRFSSVSRAGSPPSCAAKVAAHSRFNAR